MKSLLTLLLKLRNRHFLLADLVIFLGTPTLALLLRTDATEIPEKYRQSLGVITLTFLLLKILVFYRGGMYRRFWHYASVDDLAHIAILGTQVLLLETAVFFGVLRPLGWISDMFPRSLSLTESVLAITAVGAIRFSIPFGNRVRQRRMNVQPQESVLIAGAGAGGVLIVQEMQRNPAMGLRPVAFVDDAPDKQGLYIWGIPVVGTCTDIPRVAGATGATKVVIAMPTAPGPVIRQIVASCEEGGLPTKTMPGIYELFHGSAGVQQLRDVRIEDLLRREPIRTDTAAVRALIAGKCVLVTGAGGSIGSELCRQLLRCAPHTLLLLGHGENSIFEIYHELLRLRDETALGGDPTVQEAVRRTVIIPIIADIRSAERIHTVLTAQPPAIIFHSAAHKHVPLMEQNPSEAIMNNIIGTRNLLAAAVAVGTEHFVMISTDKAVNPTSIMGASKRVAELLVYQTAQQTGRRYGAVRFGNVLGSRGSVVPTFQRQIAAGGPVTITHPEMVRYFMTIPEAVQLVVQAAPLGQGGEVFMLDMGQPVKVLDLAKDLIRLSGLEVGRDIAIIATGMRPGEKMFEELFLPGEIYVRTQHEKIFIVANAGAGIPATLAQAVVELQAAAEAGDNVNIRLQLQRLIPEFQPPATGGTHLPQTTGLPTAGRSYTASLKPETARK